MRRVFFIDKYQSIGGNTWPYREKFTVVFLTISCYIGYGVPEFKKKKSRSSWRRKKERKNSVNEKRSQILQPRYYFPLFLISVTAIGMCRPSFLFTLLKPQKLLIINFKRWNTWEKKIMMIVRGNKNNFRN